MKPIEIDFIRRRRTPVIECALLLAAAVLLGDRVHDYRQISAEKETIQARIAMLQDRVERQSRLRMQKPDADPEQSTRRAGETKMLVALNYPWDKVLSVIERPDVPGVALLSFSHDAQSRQIRLGVEAIDVAALGTYVQQLNEASANRLPLQWYVGNYQVQSQNVPATVKASVLAK